MYGNSWRGLPEGQIVEYVSRLEQRVKNLESSTFRIPILDAPPEDGDPCNIWFYEDGRLLIRNSSGTVYTYQPEGRYTIPALSEAPGVSSQIDFWVNATNGRLYVRGPNNSVATYDANVIIDLTGTKTPTPPPPKPTEPIKKTYKTTWTASWSESYQGDSNRRTDNNHLYYGRYSSERGTQRSLIGFDYNAIKSSLSGAAINKVEIYLSNIHAYYNNGVYIKIGAHNNASRPSTYSGAVKYLVNSVKYGKPESAWRTISNWFGTSFQSGNIKGVLLDPRDGALALYGYAAGVGDSGYTPPKIRITYTK